jgi:hypothetical protein
MRPAAQELPVGIVFRRLRTEVGDWTWFGLCDVAAGGTGLLGAAAVRFVRPRVVELCAWTVPGAPPVGDRLVREVADAMRAEGAEQMIARLPQERDLLVRAGSQPLGRQEPDDDSAGWLSLEL